MDRKKAQLKMSFGMIFSIILIIVFIAFAMFIIMKVLSTRDTGEIALFLDNFQNDIDNVWQAAQASQEKTYSLPDKVEGVCFTNDSRLYFEPIESGENLNYNEILHIDIEAMNADGEFCLEVINGKLNVVLEKSFGDKLVLVKEG